MASSRWDPIELSEISAAGGTSANDTDKEDDQQHEAEAEVALDNEMICRGSIRIHSVEVPSKDEHAPGVNAPAMNGDEEIDHSDILLRVSGPPVPVLLSRIFHASSISLIFQQYHQTILKMSSFSNQSFRLQVEAPSTPIEGKTVADVASDSARLPQQLYPVPQYFEYWFDIKDTRQFIEPVTLAVDDILSRVLDQILNSVFENLKSSSMHIRTNVIAELVVSWIETVYVSNDTLTRHGGSSTSPFSLTRDQLFNSDCSRSSGLSEIEMSEVFNALKVVEQNRSPDSREGTCEQNALKVLGQVDDRLYIAVPSAAPIQDAYPADLTLSVPPLSLAVLARSDCAVKHLAPFVQGQHATLDVLQNNAFHVLAVPTMNSEAFDKFADSIYKLPGDDLQNRLHAPNRFGQTPLYLASICGHVDAVRWFLKVGVKPTDDSLHATLRMLHFSPKAPHRSEPIFRCLREHLFLEKPEDWNWPWKLGRSRCVPNMTVKIDMYHAAPEHNLVSDPKFKARQAFFTNDSARQQSALNKALQSKNMFSSFACFRLLGNKPCLEDILQAGITHGNIPLVMSSLNRGASVQALESICLGKAEEAIRDKVVCEAQAGAMHAPSIASSTKTWQLPLHAAASQSNAELVRVLIGLGASLHLRSPQDGTSVLHKIGMISKPYDKTSETILGQRAYRSRTLSTDDVEDMLEERRRIYEMENEHRDRTLDTARALLELGADADAADIQGITPLHIATKRGDFMYVELLLSHGARPTSISPVASHRTPSSSAGHNNVKDGGDSQKIQIARMTPVHLAIEGDHLRCLRTLLRVHGSAGLSCSRLRTNKSMTSTLGLHSHRCGGAFFSAAATKVNFQAAGILANASGREFNSWSRKTVKPSIIGTLAATCLKVVQSQTSLVLTKKEREKRGNALCMIILLLQNGLGVANNEYAQLDALARMLPGVHDKFAAATKEGAKRVLSRERSVAHWPENKVCHLQGSSNGSQETILSFWADAQDCMCYGKDCKRISSFLSILDCDGANEAGNRDEIFWHCVYCGLSYCVDCGVPMDTIDAKTNHNIGHSAKTLAGEVLNSCICLGCLTR